MLFTDIRHKSNNPRKLLETVSPASQALFRLVLLIQVITDELIEPAEDLIVPLETTQKVKIEQNEKKSPAHLFPWFKTQWFSSGKITNRLGTPSLYDRSPPKKKTKRTNHQNQIQKQITQGDETHSCKAWKAPIPSVSGSL